jgi:hypothetical protein
MQRDPGDFTRDPLIRTAQWIAIVENAEKPPSEAFAYDLDTFFKPPVETFHRMWEEIKRAGRHRVLPPGFEAYVELESEATSFRQFEALLVTGILQTEPYARDVLKAGQKLGALDQLVASRAERQAIMERESPPRLWFITDETVIRRNIGGGEVVRSQLQRLLAYAQEPNITIQVVRENAGSCPGLEGSFTILSFDNVLTWRTLKVPVGMALCCKSRPKSWIWPCGSISSGQRRCRRKSRCG